jgi:hypothetical protein
MYGGCVNEGSSRVNDYSGYQESKESCCFLTKCPECGGGVFFIRHNRGSVWIDPPLGPPWYKHGCFDEAQGNGAKNVLSKNYGTEQIIKKAEEDENLLIGIVKSTRVDDSKFFTDITFETGATKCLKLKIKNNAGFLLGRLCILNKEQGEISPIDEPEYLFAIFDPRNRKSGEMIKCPKCHVRLNPKNLKTHLRRQHGTG